LGAAYLAGLAVGYWKSAESLATHWKVDKRFEPKMKRRQASGLRGRWKEALSRAKAWEKPARAIKR
jgi:glycerol kinase